MKDHALWNVKKTQSTLQDNRCKFVIFFAYNVCDNKFKMIRMLAEIFLFGQQLIVT